MSSKVTIASAAALVAVFAAHVPADAAQVNTPGTAFHTQWLVTDGIFYSGISGMNFTAGSLTMIAPLARVPGAGPVTVYVDGWGAATQYKCTVWASSPGRPIPGISASKSFTITYGGAWTVTVNFTAEEVPASSYLSITCTAPADGGFRGVTVAE